MNFAVEENEGLTLANTHPVEWEGQALTQAAEGRGLQAMDGQP